MKRVKLVMMISLIFQCYSYGAYLRDIPITITQPDGTKIECFATGDEYYNWTHDGDGYTIVQNKITGDYCYAILDGDDLIASNYVVGRVSPKSVNLQPHTNISGEKILEKANRVIQNIPQKENIQKSGGQLRATTATTKTLNNIVVFIRFADQPEFPTSFGYTYSQLFNSMSSGANSMRNYFKEVSYNQLNIESHFYPGNSGYAIFSYPDSHDRDYYRPYDAVSNPSGYKDFEKDEREHTLLYNAIDSINKLNIISPYLDIDFDDDGYVDNVCFVVQGSVDNGSILWPHAFSLYSKSIYINGKRVSDYNLQLGDLLVPYLNQSGRTDILCHEMYHSSTIAQANDLYHLNNMEKPVGSWDLMADNLNPPQHMGAYMKYKHGGWIPDIPSITTSGTYTLQPLALLPSTLAANNCYKIPITGSSQYIVLEYRKKTGTFESSIPGSGLLIYRIDESYFLYGNVRGNGPGGKNRDEVYIFRPDGTTYVEGDINNAHFSETVGRTIFSNSSNPFGFTAPNGDLANIYIKNIRENVNGTLSFDVRFCDDDDIIISNTNNLPAVINASNSIQTSGTVVVKSTDNVTFEAGDEIILGPGFEVESGGAFEINMNGCGE